MTTKILQAAAFALAASLASAPAISQAATASSNAPVRQTYQTSLRSLYGLPSPWTGTLQLTMNPDGIIQGYYHPADDYTKFIPVEGGRNGDQVWLDIGHAGRLHVSGTIKNDNISGAAIDETTMQQYAFTARVSS